MGIVLKLDGRFAQQLRLISIQASLTFERLGLIRSQGKQSGDSFDRFSMTFDAEVQYSGSKKRGWKGTVSKNGIEW